MRPQGQLDQLQLLTYLAFNCVSLELQSHACIQLIADDIMHCRQIYMCHPRAQPDRAPCRCLVIVIEVNSILFFFGKKAKEEEEIKNLSSESLCGAFLTL